VTPIYYVFFTTCVIIASSILFRELSSLPAEDWIGLFCGFCIVLAAIFLLHFCKNYDITLASIAQQVLFVREDEPSGYKGLASGDPHSTSDSDENSKSEQDEGGSRKRISSQGSYGATEFI